MKIEKVGEFGLIERLSRFAPAGKGVFKGIGDDAAVLPYTKSKYQLLTTDMMAEDVHFTRDMGAQKIGYKALAVNISDIAAMGGLPTYAVVSIGLPKARDVRFVEDLYKGMAVLAKKFNVSIVGGDTIKADKLIINVALMGEVEKKYLVTRDGAKPGDWIFVSGPLGGSLTSGRHLTFTPRIKEARHLVKTCKPSAMMDLSDGLAGDLDHILKASHVGAQLLEDAVPRNMGVSLKDALTNGEDFELLFTVPPSKAERLMEDFYPIGIITADTKQRINAKGFTHF